MALSDTNFSNVLQGIFYAMKTAANDSPKDDKWLADQLAAAIDDQIKTATVTVSVARVTGVTTGSGTSGPGTGTGAIT